MKDWGSPAGQRVLFRASTDVLDALVAAGQRDRFPTPEAVAVLMIALGRFAGRHGFRTVSEQEIWNHLLHQDVRAWFSLGFASERGAES